MTVLFVSIKPLERSCRPSHFLLDRSLSRHTDPRRFRIRTNWTNSVSETHEFTLDDLFDAAIRDKLKWAMSDPERLQPDETRQTLTERAAATFAFVEDVGLLPDNMFTRMLGHPRRQPDDFAALARDLFGTMATGRTASASRRYHSLTVVCSMTTRSCR